MRKVLMLAILLAGAGFLAAKASEHGTAPAQESSQTSGQNETVRKDGDRTATARDGRADESEERARPGHRQAREDDEDNDRDRTWVPIESTAQGPARSRGPIHPTPPDRAARAAAGAAVSGQRRCLRFFSARSRMLIVFSSN